MHTLFSDLAPLDYHSKMVDLVLQFGHYWFHQSSLAEAGCKMIKTFRRPSEEPQPLHEKWLFMFIFLPEDEDENGDGDRYGKAVLQAVINNLIVVEGGLGKLKLAAFVDFISRHPLQDWQGTKHERNRTCLVYHRDAMQVATNFDEADSQGSRACGVYQQEPESSCTFGRQKLVEGKGKTCHDIVNQVTANSEYSIEYTSPQSFVKLHLDLLAISKALAILAGLPSFDSSRAKEFELEKYPNLSTKTMVGSSGFYSDKPVKGSDIM
ncbi:hypothetical protein F5146DRAFT_998077 [Armillaria mellea]|nr:hypothetical protein F5146DRAFT_998077 [Armillaria mellea]